MRVGLVTPYSSIPRGNAISAWRLQHGLTQVGVEVTLCGLDRSENIEACIDGADVVHVLHAYRSGRFLLDHQDRGGTLPPVVVSFTGTDLAYDWADPEKGPIIRQVCELASAIVVYHEAAKQELSQGLPTIADKVRVIGPAVHLAESKGGLRNRLGLPPEAVIFLFPAGIRPVKNLLFPLPLLADLQTEHPDLHVIYVGPIIEEEEGRRLQSEIERYPWAHYLGVIPHEEMAGVYADTDVVLNTSLHEGLANAVLEAMYMRRPVLASHIPANAAVIRDGVNGLLYDSPETFRAQAKRLLKSPTLRKALGDASGEFVRQAYTLEAEIAAYHRLYEEVVRV